MNPRGHSQYKKYDRQSKGEYESQIFMPENGEPEITYRMKAAFFGLAEWQSFFYNGFDTYRRDAESLPEESNLSFNSKVFKHDWNHRIEFLECIGSSSDECVRESLA